MAEKNIVEHLEVHLSPFHPKGVPGKHEPKLTSTLITLLFLKQLPKLILLIDFILIHSI